eukprot:733207-Prymnesium_polylepis.1
MSAAASDLAATSAASHALVAVPEQPDDSSAAREMLSADEQALVLRSQWLSSQAIKAPHGYDRAVACAFLGLLGEGVALDRVVRTFSKPMWAQGECPGCARVLRLLVTPSLDVIRCIYCQNPMLTPLASVFEPPSEPLELPPLQSLPSLLPERFHQSESAQADGASVNLMEPPAPSAAAPVRRSRSSGATEDYCD